MSVDIGRDLYGLRPARPSPASPAVPARAAHPCQACASSRVHRDVPTSAYERWLLPMLGHRPYRCVDCGHRFYDRPRIVRTPAGLRKGASPRPLEETRA